MSILDGHRPTLRFKRRRDLAVVMMLVLYSGILQSATTDFRGQVSGSATWNSESSEAVLGLRYIPYLSFEQAVSVSWSVAGEASAQLYRYDRLRRDRRKSVSDEIKSYRLWLRMASARLEARLGLQKINFGSAVLMRPLMWFDRLDPRDPLQLTDGVYGALMRYYFLNNSNVWFWALLGNDTTKGWEIIPSNRARVELGGRFQMPVPRGELALSLHRRELDLSRGLLGKTPVQGHSDAEHRIALDGKWDLGFGLWFEGSYIKRELVLSDLNNQFLATLGADYTFAIGNGLHALYESFWMRSSSKALGAGPERSFSAISVNYPLGLLDRVSGMFFYDWESVRLYRFLNWQRQYDHWSFYCIAFWNPEQFDLQQNLGQENIYAGKGLQVMVVFNH